MKYLLLAALFCLAAANKCRDEERIYKYETQLASGLIPNSPLRSGIKLSAHARMQFKCHSTEVRVQLINVVLYKIDQPLVQIKPESRTIPNEFLKEWVGADQVKIIEAIQIPFAFQYTKAGQVTDLAFNDNDMTINIKKGLISLFEVNLEKRLVLGDDPFRSKTIEPEHTTKYTVFERSTTGDCATQYFVHPMTIDAKHVMTVDKVRDYSKCFNAPGYRKSQFFEGIEMPESFKANPLTHTSNIRYSITGRLNHFVITSAVVEERIIFSPYYTPKETEEVRTTVNQTLVLYETKRLSEASPISEVKMSPPHQAFHKANHLTMTIPNSDVTSHVHKLHAQVPDVIRQGMSALAYPVDKIVHQLQHVAENVQEITSKESLVHMRVAIEMLRSSPYADIKKAFVMLTSTNAQTPINKFAVEILWTALNHVGTDAAAHFLLDTCTTDATLIHNCSWTLTQLTLSATPTPEIINKITKMLESTVAETPVMKMKLYLTLGSFAYKMNSLNARKLKELEMQETVLTPLTKETQNTARDVITTKLSVISKQKTSIHKCTKETSEKIMKILTDLLEKTDVKDKILALKAIRNSGLPAAVPVLKKFLVDENIKKAMPYVRVLAILAHSRFVDHPTARAESTSFLVDLLMHTTEANEIRTAAFHVLMSLKPDLPLMEMIAVKMQSEKDLQLTSYVLSYLESYANSTFTPVMAFSKNATVALKSAPVYATGVDHAFYKFGGYYNEKFRMGSSFKLASHGSMDRFMSWDFALDTVLFGKSTTPFSMNVATQGMSSLISNLFGAKGIKSLSTNLISQLLRTSSGSINPKQFIENIISGINMKPRAMESFQAQAQLNMFGHEVRYFESVADLLQFFIPGDKLQFSMVKDTIQASLPLNIASTMYLMDAKVSMPTESGFPVSLQTQLTSSMKVDGDVKVDAVLPSEVKGLNLPQMLPKNVDLDVNINKKCVLGLYASMGLDAFFVKPTVGFHGLIKVVAPMKHKTTVNLATGIMEKEFRLPQQDAPIVETVFEPVSEFLTIYNTTAAVHTVDYVARPIYASVNERVTPIAITLPIPFLGHELKVIGQSPVSSFYPIPASPLRGRSEMKLSLVPGANAPSVVTIKSKLMCMWNAKTSEALKASAVDDSPIQKDPINLSAVTKLTMPMVMKKLMTAGGKVVPTAVNPWDMAFVVTVDASSSGVVRQMQAEYFTHQTDSVNHQHFRMLRLWTSAIPGWTEKDLQLIGEFDVTSPTKVYTPENVYSIEWQKQLLRDLEYYINSPIESTKVMNTMMNMTLTSISEQLYQPNLAYVPASRVLDSLMPEIYYSKIMTTPAVPEKTLLVLSKVQEELQVIVDPSFRNRNVIVMELFDQLIESQQTKINYLQQIVGNMQQTDMTEVAYTQWMVMKNADTLVMLKEIVAKYQATGAITNIDEIKPKMVKSSELLVTILKTIESILLNKKLSYTVAKPGAAVPEVQVTEPLKDMSSIHSIEDLKVPGAGVPTEKNVVTGIQVVCLKQIQEMIKIMEKLNAAQEVDVSSMQGLMHQSQKALAFYDHHIKSKFLTAQPIPNFLILTTVQNEFIVKLWQSYMNLQVVSAKIVPAEDKKSIVDIGLMTKSVSFRLAIRVSQWVKAHKLALIMGDQEDETVRKMRETLLMVQRNVMIESQDFTYIQAGQKSANNVEEIAKQIIKTIDDNILIVNETVKGMHQLPNRPSVYLTSNVLETIGGLSRFTTMCRQYLYPICSTTICRLMITNMDSRVTQLSELMDILSPIYEKYNTAQQSSLVMAKNMALNMRPYDGPDMALNMRPYEWGDNPYPRNPYHRMKPRNMNQHIPSMNVFTSETDGIEAIKVKLTEHQVTASTMLKYVLSGKLVSDPVEKREVAVTDFKSGVTNFVDYLYRNCFSHPWTYFSSAEFKFKGDVAIIKLITQIIDSQVKSVDYIVGLMKTKPQLFEGVTVTSAQLMALKEQIVHIQQSIVLRSASVKDVLTIRQNTFSDLLKYFLSDRLITAPAENRVAIVTSYHDQIKLFIKYVKEECFNTPMFFGSPIFKFSGDVAIIELITNILDNQIKSIDYIVKTLKTKPELFEGLSVTYNDFIQHKDAITKIRQSIVAKDAIKLWKSGDVFYSESAGAASQIPTGVTGRLSISWGEKTAMNKNIFLEVFAGRSLEQIMWIVKQLNPSVMSPELVTDLTARMSGQVSVKEGFMDVFNTYNHIQMVANFKSDQLPQWVKNWAVAAQESLKYNLWNFYSRHSRPAGVTVPEDQIVSTIDMSGRNNKVDFTVMTNTESDVFVNVPLIPAIYKSLKPTQSLRPVSQQFIEYVSGGFSPATCTVHADQVNTWDTVRYTLPQTVTPCRTVVAMDCSADPTFAVTMVPSTTVAGAARTLEIASMDKLIKLTPVVTPGQISAEVKVNDELVTLEQDVPVIVQGVILRKGGRHVEVILPKTGVVVTLEGVVVKIQVPKLFQHRMCGLCSNFDSQKSWEFEGPQREVYRSQKDFALSYIVPNNVCPATLKPTVNFAAAPREFRNPSDLYLLELPDMDIDWNENEKASNTATCREEQRVQVKQFRKKNLICFSSKPVTECSFDCDHDKTEVMRTKMVYKCLQRTTSAVKLMRAVRRENYLVKASDLDSAVTEIPRKVTMEYNCVAPLN